MGSFVKGLLGYSVILGIGTCYAIPHLLITLLRFFRNPRKFMEKKDRSDVETIHRMENMHSVMVDVGDGITIQTVRTFQGNPTRDVLVLLHGFPEAWFSWKYQIEAFRKKYDIVAISLRGYGLSSKPKGVKNYSMKCLKKDVVEVIRSLGEDKKVILMAHDWGGAIAWNVAISHPELLSKLIVACAPHPRSFTRNINFNQFARLWYMFLFQLPFLPEISIAAEDFEAVANAFLKPPAGIHHEGRISQDDMEAYKKELSRPGALTAAINYYRALGRAVAWGLESSPDEVPRRSLAVPTLLIWADDDVALGPQLLRGTSKYVDHLKIKVLNDCSHWAQQDCPEEFNASVNDFLNAE